VSAQHHPAEARPILVVAVDDYRDRRVLGNVPHALERRAGASFRLFVDGDVERALRDREADRHHVGDRAPVGGGEMRDALMRQEPALAIRQHGSPSAAIAPRWAERRPRDTIGRRPGMRKYVMAITAQRPQIWNDQVKAIRTPHHQPEGRPEYAE